VETTELSVFQAEDGRAQPRDISQNFAARAIIIAETTNL